MQAVFGRSVVVKGEVTANEDLAIAGRVEGSITLKEHVLTVLEGGEVQASITAKSVIVVGTVTGVVEALDRLELREGSTLTGDIMAPRVAMVDGATVNGTVEMRKGS